MARTPDQRAAARARRRIALRVIGAALGGLDDVSMDVLSAVDQNGPGGRSITDQEADAIADSVADLVRDAVREGLTA